MRHQIRPARVRTPSSTHSTARPRLRRDCVEDPFRGLEAGRVPQALVVQVRQDQEPPLVTVAGELDVTSAGLLTAMIDHVSGGRPGRASRRAHGSQAHASAVDVDLDLSGVTFVDSHGLAPVLDGRSRIVAASPAVRRVRRLLHDLPGTFPHREA